MGQFDFFQPAADTPSFVDPSTPVGMSSSPVMSYLANLWQNGVPASAMPLSARLMANPTVADLTNRVGRGIVNLPQTLGFASPQQMANDPLKASVMNMNATAGFLPMPELRPATPATSAAADASYLSPRAADTPSTMYLSEKPTGEPPPPRHSYEPTTGQTVNLNDAEDVMNDHMKEVKSDPDNKLPLTLQKMADHFNGDGNLANKIKQAQTQVAYYAKDGTEPNPMMEKIMQDQVDGMIDAAKTNPHSGSNVLFNSETHKTIVQGDKLRIVPKDYVEGWQNFRNETGAYVDPATQQILRQSRTAGDNPATAIPMDNGMSEPLATKLRAYGDDLASHLADHYAHFPDPQGMVRNGLATAGELAQKGDKAGLKKYLMSIGRPDIYDGITKTP